MPRHASALQRWSSAKDRFSQTSGACIPLPVEWFLVEGDRSVIRWVFEFEDHNGRRFRLEELATQLWRGDRIIQERFHFDPAQLRR